MPSLPAEFSCAHCGRPGTAAEVATGWAMSSAPRPTGATRPRVEAEDRVSALCPDCARAVLRDLEGKLDP